MNKGLLILLGALSIGGIAYFATKKSETEATDDDNSTDKKPVEIVFTKVKIPPLK